MPDTMVRAMVGVGSPSRIRLRSDDRAPVVDSQVSVSFSATEASIGIRVFEHLLGIENVTLQRSGGNPAFLEYLAARLRQYKAAEGELRIENKAADTITDAMREISSAGDYVFPNVAPNGTGGVVLFWKAEARTIEVDLEVDDGYYVDVVDANGSTTFEEEGVGELPIETLRQALADLTSDVENANPHWRNLFVA